MKENEINFDTEVKKVDEEKPSKSFEKRLTAIENTISRIKEALKTRGLNNL